MKDNKKGFSLVEILIVIAIIGILSSIVLFYLWDAKEKAKIIRAKAEVKEIYNAIIMLESDVEEWPGHQESNKINQISNNEICSDGCSFGLSDNQSGIVSTDGNYSNWKGPYMPSIPLDPWGNEYFFDTDYDIDIDPVAKKWAVVIGSYGLNGTGNNLYDEDDIFYIIISE